MEVHMEIINLIFRLNQITKLLEHHVASDSDCNQHTLQVWCVIMYLSCQEKPICQNDLSKVLHVDKSTVSRTIKHLEQLNLISCTKTTHDGRTKMISNTDLGKQAYLTFLNAMSKVEPDLFEHINDLKLQTMQESLETLYYNMHYNTDK